jgi:hypothetical protein
MQTTRSAPSCLAMLDLFFQFVVELLRALLIDELSGHVRMRWAQRRLARKSRAILKVHRRNRDRLLHKLRTEIDGDM